MNYNYGIKPQPQQMYNPNLGQASRIRPVTSVEEVRSYPIDFDGSIFFFPDFSNNRIFTKQINMDGTAGINMYALSEIPTEQSIYATKEELVKAMEEIKSLLQTKPVVEEKKKTKIIAAPPTPDNF